MAKYDSQSDVIGAIKRASDAELRALADISRQLKNMNGGGAGGLRVVRSANAGNFRQPGKNELGRTLEQVIASASASSSSANKTGSKKAPNMPFFDSTPAQVSLSTVRKSKKALNKALDESTESAIKAVIDSLESDIRATEKHFSSRRKNTRKTNNDGGLGTPTNGQYRDKGGRLRDASGRYASKNANENAKNRRADDDHEQKETNALLKRVLTGIGHGAANMTGENSGNIAAGAAGMGVMWQVSKELLTVVKDAGDNTIKMGAWMNEGRKAIGNRKILRGFSANDARASVAENQKLASEEARKDQREDNKITHENQQKEISILSQLLHKSGKGGGGGGLMSGLAGALGGAFGGIGSGLLKRLVPKSIRKHLDGGSGKSRKGDIDLEDDLKGKGKGKGAIEPGKGKGEPGKSKGEGESGKGKVSGERGKGAAKVGSEAAQDAGKIAGKEGEKGLEKLGKGTLVKEGESAAIKGGAKVAAKIGLRAIPILGTIAGMGIDAYDGYNDDENLHRTFGEKAGTKERVAMAAANVVDMGGLISGASNLISGVLDGMGFKDASKVMQMDGSTGIAKKFDSWFSSSDKDADERNESLLDKLTEVVTGIGKLGSSLDKQAVGGLSSLALQSSIDSAMLTAKPMQFAQQSTFNAHGEINQMRKSKGWTYNPHALITLGGKNASTRGNALNNPTNLNFAGQDGAMKEVGNGQARFAAFATPEEGIRAAGNNLLTYQKKNGMLSVREIISKWAPPNENDTGAYIAKVAKTLGPDVTPETKVDATDPAITSKLITAIATYENGSFNMSESDVSKSLGSVQNGKYVGGWTDATQAELSKTAEGQAVLANNTGAGQAIVPGSATADIVASAKSPAAASVVPALPTPKLPGITVNAPTATVGNIPASAPIAVNGTKNSANTPAVIVPGAPGAITPVTATSPAGTAKIPGIAPVAASAASAAAAASTPGTENPAGGPQTSILAKGVSLVKSAFSTVNNATTQAMPGLAYDSSKAGLGLGGINKSPISSVLNADAMVNSAAKIALPTSKSGFGGTQRPDGLISGALFDAFSNATQAVNGQSIIGNLTKNVDPRWQSALSPVTNAAGNGINSVLNLGKEAVGGWINGSPSSQRSVTDLSASGARLSPDSGTQKSQQNQQSTLEEIAGYLSEMLGIQKKSPNGSPDKPSAGPQPGPAGDIPLSSQSQVMSQIIRKNR